MILKLAASFAALDCRPVRCVLLLAIAGLPGCNAVYFYETEKFSLTLEARPDPTSPISGNFGGKQRIAAIVPAVGRQAPKDPQAVEQAAAKLNQASVTLANASAEGSRRAEAASSPADFASLRRRAEEEIAKARAAVREADLVLGDAMSVMSSMRFHKLPKPDGAPFYKFGRVTIDGALITGRAAKLVSEPGRKIALLGGAETSAGSVGIRVAAVALYRSLDDYRQDPAAASELKAELDALTSVMPEHYPLTLYTGDANALAVAHARGAPVTRNTFQNVMNYLQALEVSAQAIAAASASPTLTAVGTIPVTDESRPLILAGLRSELAQTRGALDLYRRATVATPPVQRLLKYAAEGL